MFSAVRLGRTLRHPLAFMVMPVVVLAHAQAAPIFSRGEFVGDSDGLATVGNDFVAVWSMPSGTDQGNIYFRRVGP